MAELGYTKEDVVFQAQQQMDQSSLPKPEIPPDEVVEHLMSLKASDILLHGKEEGGQVKRAIDGAAKVSGWHWSAGQILAVVIIVVVIVSVVAFITWRIKRRRKIRFAKTEAVVEDGAPTTDAGEETSGKEETQVSEENKQ
ncbi:MAG: hypothetical protein Q9220_002464 [cf. Caloplaca sp. 1 TL-2023]